MPTKIVTPPCRIVWGHPLEKGIKIDPKTKKPILDKNGQERDVWSCGLAIPLKDWPAVEQAIGAEAWRMYPNGQFPRDFAWKVKRETDRDENNKLYSEREGYVGHVVITCSTEAFCPTAYKYENGTYRQLNANEFKCGDWVIAELSLDSHPGGVYINPNMFQVIGYDKEIVRRGGSDPNQAFAGQQYQLPPGVSSTPIATAHNVAPPQAATYQPAPIGQGVGPAPAHYAPPQAAPVGQPYQQPPGNYVPQTAPMTAPGGYAPAPAAHATAYPSNPAPGAYMPPPAHDFVQNAGIPGNAAGHVPQQPVAGMPPVGYGAGPATSYPTNMIPQR